MWNAFPLSTSLYVFQHEQGHAEQWAATAYVEDAGSLLKIWTCF
ncbi:hypothetical protein [Paenibacillus sp. y28]